MMTPKEIVHDLDKHIVGQDAAKRKVAIALRNRWRRSQLDDNLREEVTPKNILMIGPTGVGKTEIARRLAKLVNAPFIKVEATKFTEVGYVGRDVESIVRDLVDMAFKMYREQAMQRVQHIAYEHAEERILDALLPRSKDTFLNEPSNNQAQEREAAKQVYRKKLREHELDDREIEIDISPNAGMGVEIMAPPGMEEMTNQLQSMFQSLSTDRKKNKKLTVKDALKQVQEEEAAKLVDDEKVKAEAIEAVEENGIIFIDELDKVAKRSEQTGGDVSREGVQRDLLPLVEGCTVSTKYGMISTSHILFIASGAFHLAKPADLIPELQGRLPIRVELNALKTEDFMRILTEPRASLTEQYRALLETEGVNLEFDDTGIKRLAEIAWQVNENTENIGARRLHTIMERLLEEISFTAGDKSQEAVLVDRKYVDMHLESLVEDQDLSRYIL